MKTLLTGNENFANVENVYNEDYTAFTSVREPRGKMKQADIEWHCKEDYVSLQMLLGMLGVDEYFEIMLDGNMLYMRINELEEDKRLEESVKRFKQFADKHNKRLRAIELLNELNELTKELGSGIELS